jgi:hypothetical protein
MKISTTIVHRLFALLVISFLATSSVLTVQTHAQDGGYAAFSEAAYGREELAQMLAPVALYPDALLSQILMAATYPIEVIEADRWVRMNARLKDEALDAALLDKNWDPSVKAICHFPSILALMSERITETTNLGNAFLAQEADVLAMVQELRARAHAQGNLTSTDQQKVIVQKETIIITPADPRIIYVPYYDPLYIYGPWWYPAYRPYYWGPPGVTIGYGISYWPGFYFSFSFGNWSYFDWHRRYIYIDVQHRPRFVRHDRWLIAPGPWQHAPSHRRGVAYRDTSTARKYGQIPQRAREIGRDTRGTSGYRPQEQDRRGDQRRVVDRNDRQGERTRDDRNRQDSRQIDQARTGREQIDRERQRPQRPEGERQPPVQVRQQQPPQIEQGRPNNQRIDRDKAINQVEEAPRQQNRDTRLQRPEDAGRKQRETSERNQFSRIRQSDEARERGENRR